MYLQSLFLWTKLELLVLLPKLLWNVSYSKSVHTHVFYKHWHVLVCYKYSLFSPFTFILVKQWVKTRKTKAIDSFTLYNFCWCICLAWKGLHSRFSPIWCTYIFSYAALTSKFIKLSLSDFYGLVNMFVLFLYFIMNRSENCTKSNHNKKQNEHS